MVTARTRKPPAAAVAPSFATGDLKKILDQALNRAGLIERACGIQRGRADTAIKLRPMAPSTIDAELKRSDAHAPVGIDITAAQQTKTRPALEFCSATLETSRGAGRVAKAAVPAH